jgi:hypothetical protein
MRRYDDPVEVRKGLIDGMGESPEQFLWRGKLWKVRAVLAHWVETGSWWQSPGARAVIGSDDTGDTGDSDDQAGAGAVVGQDLLRERELWRVEAGSGMRASRRDPGSDADPDGDADDDADGGGAGVFDLSFDWSDGTWQLVGCVD